MANECTGHLAGERAQHLSAYNANEYTGECSNHLQSDLNGYGCSTDKTAECTNHLSGDRTGEDVNYFVGVKSSFQECPAVLTCPEHNSDECTGHLAGERAQHLSAYNANEYTGECSNHLQSDLNGYGCSTDKTAECTNHLSGDRTGEDVNYFVGVKSSENSADNSDDKSGEHSTFTPCPAFIPCPAYFSAHVPPCTAEELPQIDEFEPYPGEYPTLDIPTYEEYAAQFPQGQLPTYEEYQSQFPQLTVERYEEYAKEYPGLGDMYELSEAGIRQLMATTGLPVEQIMKAYTAEEKAFLDERLPEIREQWSSVGLMRSGMTAAQELKEVGVSARKMATTRAELEKESVIMQQQGLQAGIQLAMQHTGMGYEAATDAFRSGQQEYQKAHDSAVQAGLSEYEAKVQGYNAQIDEYTKKFVSSVEATQFVQGIEERAFEKARQEWQKVFDSQVAKGLTEFEAEQASYEAGRDEYARVQQLEFDKWQTEYTEEMKKYLMELGFSAQQAAAAAQGWGNIFGTIISIIFGAIFGV